MTGVNGVCKMETLINGHSFVRRIADRVSRDGLDVGGPERPHGGEGVGGMWDSGVYWHLPFVRKIDPSTIYLDSEPTTRAMSECIRYASLVTLWTWPKPSLINCILFSEFGVWGPIDREGGLSIDQT